MRPLTWLFMALVPLACSSNEAGSGDGPQSCEVDEDCMGAFCACKSGARTSQRLCSGDTCLGLAELCEGICGSADEIELAFPWLDEVACEPELAGTSGTPAAFEVVSSPAGGLSADETHVYFVQGAGLARVPVQGGNVEQISAPGLGSLWFGPVVSGDFIYGAAGELLDPDIVKIPKQGGAPVVLGKSGGTPKQMLVVGQEVHWTHHAGFWKVSTAGGTPAKVMEGMQFSALTADESALYAVRNMVIYRVPLAGGAPKAIGAASLGDLAVTADAVVATDWPDGNVFRVAKEGGSVELIACGLSAPSALAIAAERAFWVEVGKGISYSPVSAGPARTLVADPDISSDLVVAGGFLWWTSSPSSGPSELRKTALPP